LLLFAARIVPLLVVLFFFLLPGWILPRPSLIPVVCHVFLLQSCHSEDQMSAQKEELPLSESARDEDCALADRLLRAPTGNCLGNPGTGGELGSRHNYL